MTDVDGPADAATSLALAQPEDSHSKAEWEAAAAAVLRKTRKMTDADPDALVWDKLTHATLDGIAIPPLGVAGAPEPAVRPSRVGGWDIRALVSHSEAKLANEEALVDLDGGVTSLWVAADETTDVAAVLAGVLLDLAPVVLDAPTVPTEAARALLAYADERGLDLHPDSNLGADPLGAMLRELPLAVDEAVAELRDLAAQAKAARVRAIVVDATAAHDLGASDVQELAWSVAVGVAYLRWLTDHGFDLADAADLIEFRYAATDEQFPTIAKLRAARQLWASVLQHSGLPADVDVAQRQHAVTSRPMLSKYDPYVNMLRGTVAAFAAGVGGADAITVLPFDAALGRPEAFGRRIARNVSHLLIDESHVAAVADPAGGAYAVEQLTADLAAAGWAAFQQLEEEWEGGHDLTPFRERIAAAVAERERQVARRRRPLTGVTEFPNLAEVLPVRDADPLNDRAARYGASFEAMRDEPAATPVFLATLGTVAQHTARATFASNLFAAGGIAVEVAGPTAGVDELLASYAGQPVVCLAGNDVAYAEWGAAAVEALRGAGAQHVIIAGVSTSSTTDIFEVVDDSCALGVDALAFLTATREKLS
ncbi:methylmalonyl-CoA mutase family protein [Nocardioides sp. HM23]|uniref:methylmalonyl-CoA mutase family protein n=1 Tax=Nocardioides bizhenqiangii TaxID=3095076 RepID=UPI002ACA932B|nr:methylmalonyl-CoA mutase family protein [Nocardioides sp. HM23]MDZ5621543.1 methylmalonyl-CoA mutase family protein [Nocardioides sp. HM23]